MLSYLSNRHYHELTQLLPPQLRNPSQFLNNLANNNNQNSNNTNTSTFFNPSSSSSNASTDYKQFMQAQKIYYRTFINNDILHEYQQSKKTSSKCNSSLASSSDSSTKKLLLTRKKTINISLQKLNACPLCFQQHIYVQYYGYCHICVKCRSFVRDQFGNQIKIYLDQNGDIVCLGILPKNYQRNKVSYYVTDYSKLDVGGIGVYASFAGENQLVLILKQKEKKKQNQNKIDQVDRNTQKKTNINIRIKNKKQKA